MKLDALGTARLRKGMLEMFKRMKADYVKHGLLEEDFMALFNSAVAEFTKGNYDA